ncbi:phosphodiester glycosidase family protein [Bacillus sp. FJAT-49736]|uniref:phosphodiester glycosidase family protein n=1 Tax=Bacillus sp. FJAT-49736 TaxID=2833582 RepID=UPI001BCA3AAE|nr:phosphodiester glycosidase family protein [Bacillus sp. FJAT-49736]MBS4174033.1 phosphodiester glycosidase family protein [Bacillus sp. FJAT-49736]
MSELKMETTLATRSSRRRKRSKKRIWRIIGAIFLTSFLLGCIFIYTTDTGLQLRKMLVGTVLSTQHARYAKYLGFLLTKTEMEELLKAFHHPPTAQSTVTGMDPNKKEKLSVRVDTIETSNYTAKVLIISDPTKVHLVQSRLSNKGQPLSDLIKENNGIAGINGGGFVDRGGTGSGGTATGIVISKGDVLTSPRGNRNTPLLVGGFLKDGQFITGKYSVNELLNLGVTDAVSFGPQLIVDGVNRVTSSIDGAWGWAPRTAIGQAKDGSVIMIITDGRFYWDKTHRGASMSDMAGMFEKYHVTNAIAMDGGGSTTMIYNEQLLLKPATDTAVGMRYLPNAWVVIP